MRIVNLELEGTVLIPVKFRAELLVRADDDASIEKAVQSWAKGQKYPKAEIEDTSLIEVLEIGGEPVEDFNLGKALSSALVNGLGGIEVKDFLVTDSR